MASFSQEYMHASFGVMSTPSVQLLPRLIVSPAGIYYRIWQFFLSMLSLYSTWMLPFETLFLGRASTSVFVTNGVANAFFLIDIILSFSVAYPDEATKIMVHDRISIARRYVPWLLADIGFISLSMFKTKHLVVTVLYGLLNFAILYRRVVHVLGRMEKNIKCSYFWVRCIKFICVTLFVIHYAGCIFYFIAVHHNDSNKSWIGESMDDLLKKNLWIRYMTCIYLSITTLTTVGYGDFHPTNALEMLFASCYMIFNFGFAAYLIGNVADLFVHMTNQTRKFRDSIQAVSKFGLCNHLDGAFQEEDAAFQEEVYIESCLNFMHQQEAFESLPRATKSNLLYLCYGDILRNVYLFDGISSGSIHHLVSEMKIEYFANNKYIFFADQAPTDIYVIVKGGVEMQFHILDIQQAGAGKILGDVGFICNQPHQYSLRTNEITQLLRLDRTTFLDIIRSNVTVGTTIIQNFLKHCKDNSRLQSVLIEIERKLMRGRLDIPVSPYYAVEREDTVMLKNLLAKGLDPDESYHGRKALCLSASKGDVRAVTILLENDADPNICDSIGNVPLWLAMKGGHEAVSNILLKYHAHLKHGDGGQYACIAIQQGNLNLLREIKQHGGDIRASCRCHNENIIPGTQPEDFASVRENKEIKDFFEELKASSSTG